MSAVNDEYPRQYRLLRMHLRNMCIPNCDVHFPHLLSKNVKIRMYKTIILPVVPYGCETWSPTLK
jgi:hypothetical protein